MVGNKGALQRRVSELKIKLAQAKCNRAIYSDYGKGYYFTEHELQ